MLGERMENPFAARAPAAFRLKKSQRHLIGCWCKTSWNGGVARAFQTCVSASALAPRSTAIGTQLHIIMKFGRNAYESSTASSSSCDIWPHQKINITRTKTIVKMNKLFINSFSFSRFYTLFLCVALLFLPIYLLLHSIQFIHSRRHRFRSSTEYGVNL